MARLVALHRRSPVVGRRRHGQPLLRLFDVRHPYRRRPDSARGRRGLHLRRRREHDADPDGWLQPDAQPRPRCETARRLSRHGRYRGKCRATLADHPRTAQEELAVRSHKLAPARRRTAASLRDEIVPIETRAGLRRRGRVHSAARPPSDALAGLKPAFDAEGTVTAGTSSPLTDGAAAVLVCSEDYARRDGARAAGAPRPASPSPAARPTSWESARSPPRARRCSAPD